MEPTKMISDCSLDSKNMKMISKTQNLMFPAAAARPTIGYY
jgi:hypothetical protein